MLSARLTFLHREYATVSVLAAFATRDKRFPVYTAECRSETEREPVKGWMRCRLRQLASRYEVRQLSDDEHIQSILELKNAATAEFSCQFHGGRLRFGVTQKLLNLYLKYLWLSGLVKEPPHCPIDGRVRDGAGLGYAWTRSDCEGEYRAALAQLRATAHPRSLAVWELEFFEAQRNEA